MRRLLRVLAGSSAVAALERPRLACSQFVFTQVKGRDAVFWQTQKTARAADPGGRIPRRRSLPDAVTIAVDTRERYPYRFAQQGAETTRALSDSQAGNATEFRPLQRWPSLSS
jgi:hypothetical protein